MGTAGTITSFAAIAQGLPTYEPTRIQNFVLELPVIQRIECDVFGKTQSDRVGMSGLEAGLEGVIAAGSSSCVV